MERFTRIIIWGGRWAAALSVWTIGVTPFVAGAVLSIVINGFVGGWNEVKTRFFS